MPSALITLTTAGTGTGPFDLYSNVNGYSTPFETNVPKNLLVAGYTSTSVLAGTTIIRVQSTSAGCPNYVDISVVGITTSTTTTSTTAAPIVNPGNLYNNSPNTISSSYVTILVNGSSKAGFTLPPLAPGGTFTFPTTYTSTVPGTFEVRFYTTNSGISGANYFNMTSGWSSTTTSFTNTGAYWGAAVTSTGSQYILNINFY
jgi:hypothetical protein